MHKNNDNQIVLPYYQHIQYVAVGHTHMHIKDKSDKEIYAMILTAKKTGKFFSRKLLQFFNGRKALKNMHHANNPLIISHLHTGNLNNTSSTIHYHFAFGNIDNCISTEEMQTIFAELWIGISKQSNKSIWLQQAKSDNTAWLHYGNREFKLNNLLGLDIYSTSIPHNAYKTSISL